MKIINVQESFEEITNWRNLSLVPRPSRRRKTLKKKQRKRHNMHRRLKSDTRAHGIERKM